MGFLYGLGGVSSCGTYGYGTSFCFFVWATMRGGYVSCLGSLGVCVMISLIG